jgi:hypothetical protein
VSVERHPVQREAGAVCLGRIEEAIRRHTQEFIGSTLRKLPDGSLDVSEIEMHVHALCDAHGVARQPVVIIEAPPLSRLDGAGG